MASSEPVSGVRILGVILPGGGKEASVVETHMLAVSPWWQVGQRAGPLLSSGPQGQESEGQAMSVYGRTTT